MPTHPADTHPARATERLPLARVLLSLTTGWAERIHLRRLAAQSSDRLLRDIGLTAADLDHRLARLPGSNLADRADERSGNW